MKKRAGTVWLPEKKEVIVLNKKQDVSGLVFSAILVIAFVLCSYFFVGIVDGTIGMQDNVKLLFKALVFVLFGLILFYATRIGDGKQVKRFSLATLLILDLPALYIILSAAAPGLPFPLDLTQTTEVVWLAAAALGYGIPYTFLSGYEQDIVLEAVDEVPEESGTKDELDDGQDNTEDDAEEDQEESSEDTIQEENKTEETDASED